MFKAQNFSSHTFVSIIVEDKWKMRLCTWQLYCLIHIKLQWFKLTFSLKAHLLEREKPQFPEQICKASYCLNPFTQTSAKISPHFSGPSWQHSPLPLYGKKIAVSVCPFWLIKVALLSVILLQMEVAWQITYANKWLIMSSSVYFKTNKYNLKHDILTLL